MTVKAAGNVTLGDIEAITIEQPDKGNLGRRINLSGNDLKWLPMICAWGAPSAEESTTASSFDMVGDLTTASFLGTEAFFDLPITQFPTESDVRVYILAGANQAITCEFSFLDSGDASRHGAFRQYSGPSSTGGTWNLPADGQMTGLILAEWDSTGNWADRATETEINRLSINGVEDKTFRNLLGLGMEADQYFTGQTDTFYELFRN